MHWIRHELYQIQLEHVRSDISHRIRYNFVGSDKIAVGFDGSLSNPIIRLIGSDGSLLDLIIGLIVSDN